MEVKCNTNPFYYNTVPPRLAEVPFSGYRAPKIRVGESADIFVRRPVATKSATGLLGLKETLSKLKSKLVQHLKIYKNNITHTLDHKIIFAIVEKELFGRNSIDSITHDLDKLILYTLGFPKSFVSKYHRKHSVHHPESGKTPNLRSMICDNIASSPEFKPEKTRSLREHFANTPALQNVTGLKEILEKYNYGEKLDFNKIKEKKTKKYDSASNIAAVASLTGAVLLGILKP